MDQVEEVKIKQFLIIQEKNDKWNLKYCLRITWIIRI